MLYPHELHCNEMTLDDVASRTAEIPSSDDIQSKPDKLNVNALEFRPKRTAATISSMKMNDMVVNETEKEEGAFDI